MNKSITKDLKVLRNFTVLFSFLDVIKQSHKTNPGKCYLCRVSTEISLDLKSCFSLVTHKINNLIALRLINKTTEIPALWWLWMLYNIAVNIYVLREPTQILCCTQKSFIIKSVRQKCGVWKFQFSLVQKSLFPQFWIIRMIKLQHFVYLFKVIEMSSTKRFPCRTEFL